MPRQAEHRIWADGQGKPGVGFPLHTKNVGSKEAYVCECFSVID